jgi:ferric-dicitrate binding protein FerR (iron transport regulator)
MKPTDSRLEALQRYCDGAPSADDVAAIERAIVDDAEFRRFAVEYFHIDSALEQFGTVSETAPVAKPIGRRIRWALAAAAGMALMGLALEQWWAAKSSPAPIEIEVLQLMDAKFAAANSDLQSHHHARVRSVHLRSGEAQLRLSSDVKLVLSGPAELRFVDPMHARLLQGKVTVDCGTRGQGFTVDTPVTRVVDVSTQFGVEARADGTTDVMVIKGSVKISDPQLAQPLAPLEQGEAVRVDAKRSLARIVNITGGQQPDDWSTKPPAADCNIVSVSDNFGAGEGFHFYRTVPHGLRPGALVYTNRTHVWRSVAGQDFPAALMNADVVQTFFGELKHPDYTIELVVARPVELFVIMPRRGSPQAWLTENFTRTGDEVMLDENQGQTPAHLYFEVWKRIVPKAGTVTLGPGNRDANGNALGMYGIATKALPL